MPVVGVRFIIASTSLRMYTRRQMTSRPVALAIGLMLAGGTWPAAAQERQFGVKAGGSYARLEIEPEAGGFDKGRFGVTGGGFAVLPLDRRFSVQLEALFSPKGASDDIDGAEGTITLQLDYLEIPALLRIAGPAAGSKRVHFFGGPTLGLRLAAHQQSKLTTDFLSQGAVDDIGDLVKRFEVAVVAGAGVDIGRRLVIDGRYAWGLTNVTRNEADSTRIRTRLFSVMAGFRF